MELIIIFNLLFSFFIVSIIISTVLIYRNTIDKDPPSGEMWAAGVLLLFTVALGLSLWKVAYSGLSEDKKPSCRSCRTSIKYELTANQKENGAYCMPCSKEVIQLIYTGE